MPSIIPVILCGGSGTRLWPLSRSLYPKQFVDLGGGRTLFGDTLRRSRDLPGCAAPVVVCNEAHRFYVAAALDACGMDARVLLEPAPRNTASALALAALALRSENDPLLLAMPADHVIDDEEALREGVALGARLAAAGSIVTFGITPTGPEEGFGYIEQGAPLEAGGFRIARFVEKPGRELAERLLATGGYYWNSGIFLFRASTYLGELERCAPQIFAACREAWREHTPDGRFFRPAAAHFLASPAISMDYAVMERTGKGALVPLGLRWRDLGSWDAFYAAAPQDARHNASAGDVLLVDADGNYVRAEHRLVAALGVRDLVVVETPDAVLVAARDRVQDVKAIVEQLKRDNRPECIHHRLVCRPWGSYETLALDDRFQVKRITVKPGGELSLQMHHHRAEHWVVVTGTAEVTNGEEKRLLTENQSAYIPVGVRHRLKNPGVIPLVLIEIQSGAYLGEDDIVRFADVYGR